VAIFDRGLSGGAGPGAAAPKSACVDPIGAEQDGWVIYMGAAMSDTGGPPPLVLRTAAHISIEDVHAGQEQDKFAVDNFIDPAHVPSFTPASSVSGKPEVEGKIYTAAQAEPCHQRAPANTIVFRAVTPTLAPAEPRWFSHAGIHLETFWSAHGEAIMVVVTPSGHSTR
jgi:hypothetical protein